MAGTRVRETTRLAIRAKDSVSTISVKSSLVMPVRKAMGMNTHTVVRVEAATAPATWRALETADFTLFSPRERSR